MGKNRHQCPVCSILKIPVRHNGVIPVNLGWRRFYFVEIIVKYPGIIEF